MYREYGRNALAVLAVLLAKALLEFVVFYADHDRSGDRRKRGKCPDHYHTAASHASVRKTLIAEF